MIDGVIESQLYPQVNIAWQDGPGKFYKSQVALDASQRNFSLRIPHELQEPKMADTWPTENVQVIMQQDQDGVPKHKRMES